MTRQPEPTVATGPHTSQASITTIPNPKPVAPRFARPPCAALRLRSSLSIYIYYLITIEYENYSCTINTNNLS